MNTYRTGASRRLALTLLAVSAFEGGCAYEADVDEPSEIAHTTQALAAGETATNLCFTKGHALYDAGGGDTTGQLVTTLEGPATRGVLGHPSSTSPTPVALAAPHGYQKSELSFRYEGRVANPVQTGSGLTRYQVAAKLRAKNGCNVLYVTWIFDQARLLIQRKRNAGMSSSAACNNNGYVQVADLAAPAEPALHSDHVLSAALTGSTLTVTIDGVQYFSGLVPDVESFDGPPGMRTDNVNLAFTLRAKNDPSPGATTYVVTSATNGTGAQGSIKSCPFGE